MTAAVIIESPYAGNIELNEKYAKAAMLDSLQRGEAPFLSHLLYTQVLDDTNQEERRLGISAGLEFGKRCDFTAVYTDLGISIGMRIGIDKARKDNRAVVFRSIEAWREFKTPEEIACSVWGVEDTTELTVKTRKREVVEARWAVMQYYRSTGSGSRNDIAAKFNLDGKAQLNGEKQIDILIQYNREFRTKYEHFKEQVDTIQNKIK